MRCPKCKFCFSEELKSCPRCGQDMGLVIEKIGLFPPSSKSPFLKLEDFVEKEREESLPSAERVIEFPYSS
ncbi:MAG: hypothetical protein ACK4K4_04485 [Caldimicrobium sp.]